jgi:uncharacterized Zn finger protein
MGYYYENGYPPYVPVAERRAKAQRKLTQMRKKNPNLSPILIEGRALATTWWGKSWNRNLERYADYSNRIGRGRSYARHGSILDLQLSAGTVRALVQGSQSQPYHITITVDKLSARNWSHIRQACEGNFDSLSELLAGQFPRALQELFFADGSGLFPTPREIQFDCSCPDWASMCKHVAAALYGVGARLDEDPGLFFTLRDIQIDDLISETVAETTQALLSKADTQSDNVLEDVDLGDVFGIELDDLEGSLPDLPPVTSLPSAPKRARPKTRARQKTAASQKNPSSRQKARSPKVASATGTSSDSSLEMQEVIVQLEREAAALEKRSPSATPPGNRKKRTVAAVRPPSMQPNATMQDTLLKAVGKARKGKSVDQLHNQLGWTKTQVRSAIRRATAKGLIEIVQPGLYRRVLGSSLTGGPK